MGAKRAALCPFSRMFSTCAPLISDPVPVLSRWPTSSPASTVAAMTCPGVGRVARGNGGLVLGHGGQRALWCDPRPIRRTGRFRRLVPDRSQAGAARQQMRTGLGAPGARDRVASCVLTGLRPYGAGSVFTRDGCGLVMVWPVHPPRSKGQQKECRVSSSARGGSGRPGDRNGERLKKPWRCLETAGRLLASMQE
ncbi:hypothetical protein SAMN04488042_101186 [Shimia aestuarii]|uniref:Uncharacterized protein n=1 Tax=Shimia aestuarii TaxID=254406 RepID=A0A1I4HN46_9RHOB|nr:hypothetical protein SAMN04488042_101186 [Shimia aestuarii]